MIDWQDLHYFSVLARAGSLSAAARLLGVDHATVGRRLAALEAALGLRLVDRLPRSLPLTPDGQALAAMAEGIEERVEAIRRYARSTDAGSAAAVRVSAPPSIAAHLIAPAMPAFRIAYPQVAMTVTGVTGEVALDRGEADIAVRMTRPDDADLLVKRIGAMRFGLYALPQIASSPPESWRFIGYDTRLDHLTQQVWMNSLLAGRPVVFRAGDVFAQQAAARAGLGVVALPLFLGNADPSLVRLPAAIETPARDLWLVTYPDLRRSPAIRGAMDFLAELIGKACPARP